MKSLKLSLACFVAVAVLLSWASLNHAQTSPEKVKVEVEKKVGDDLTLFYGGGAKIKKQFPVGAVVNVYSRNRAFGLNFNQRVGKIKIISFEGDNFIKAQVVEGTVRSGDVVKMKPNAAAACMVTPAVANE